MESSRHTGLYPPVLKTSSFLSRKRTSPPSHDRGGSASPARMPLSHVRPTCFKLFVHHSISTGSVSCPGNLPPGCCSNKKSQSSAVIARTPQSLFRVRGDSRDAVCAEEEACVFVFIYSVEPKTGAPPRTSTELCASLPLSWLPGLGPYPRSLCSKPAQPAPRWPSRTPRHTGDY